MDGEGLFRVIYHVPEMFRRPRDVAMPRSNVGEWERDVAEFLAIFGKKVKKKTVFSEKKSEKKSKLALNLLPKISILKYKGKRMPTSELRNPPETENVRWRVFGSNRAWWFQHLRHRP